MDRELKEKIKLKRILGIDFGKARVGIAISDALHISVTPLLVLNYRDNSFWELLLKLIEKENVGAIVVGKPIYDTESNSHLELIEHLEKFIEELKIKSELPVFIQDESFSSKKAVATMVEIGKKKKFRATKGSTDKIAAAIILQDFINYLE